MIPDTHKAEEGGTCVHNLLMLLELQGQLRQLSETLSPKEGVGGGGRREKRGGERIREKEGQ